MYHIISIGDEAFLYKIFQFLAMLNSSGTSLYARLGLLSALIGIILVLVTAITSNGRQFPIGGYAVAIALFLVFFGHTTSVELEDYYTGRTDIVQDVPLGTAIVGSIVSNAGVAIIQYFQTGTSVPGSTTLSPQYALDALMAYRNLTNASNYCGWGTTAMCNWSRTFQSYVANCVLPEYKLHGGWWNGDPKTSSDLLSTLDVPDLGFVTNDYLSSSPGTTSTGQVSDCANTYADLNQTWNNTQTGIAAAFSGLLRINTLNGDTPADELGNAFAALGAQTTQSGQGSQSGSLPALLQQASQGGVQSVENAVGANLLARGLAKGFRDANQVGEAGVIESAANQRNVQFAAQSTLFTRTLRATMTFFEGVIYGLAPFLAFLIPLGPIGFRYAGRYLQLLVWLFLWMPLLSFVNLFEIMSVLRQMNALLPAIGNAPLISAIGLNQIEYTVSDWVGIGAYLTTAVVGLSGFVVFGSVAAFQGVAAEANAPTSLDPGMIAPDIMSTAPPLQNGPQYSASGGSALSSTKAAMMGFTGQHTLQAIASLSHSKALNLQHDLTAAGVKGVGNNFSTAEQWAENYARTHGLKFTRGVGGTGKISSSDQRTIDDQKAHSITLSAKAGGAVGGGPLSAGVSATATDQHTLSDSHSKDDSRSAGAEEHAGLDDNHAITHGNTKGDSTSFSGSRTEGFSVANKERELFNAVNTYNRAESAMSSVSAGMSVELPQAVQAISGNSVAMDSTIASAHSIDPSGFQRNLSMLDNQGYFPNSEQANTAAALLTLQGTISGGGAHAERAAVALDSALSSSVPGWSSLNVGGAMSSGAAIGTGGAAIDGAVAPMTRGIAGDVAGARQAPSSFGEVGTPGNVAQPAWTESGQNPLNHAEGMTYGAQAAIHDATIGAPLDLPGDGAALTPSSFEGIATDGHIPVKGYAEFGQTNYDNTHVGREPVTEYHTTVVTPTTTQRVETHQLLSPDEYANLTPAQQQAEMGERGDPQQ